MLDVSVRPLPRPPSALRSLLKSEAAGGIVLMGVAVVALVVANSPLAPAYFGALETKLAGLSVLHWINDALMVLFFLLVGLEIKREILDGNLSTWPNRALPGIAALGGMVVPALIYVLFNRGDPATLRGWAIPSATDIAFALGVLALLGPRVPVSLKVFLAALAILDDLGAVLIIAVFYTAELDPQMLAAAAALLTVLALMNRLGIVWLLPYCLVGLVLWFTVLRSGVHATVAGVALALTIPLKATPGRPEALDSPLHRLEHRLGPWVAFLVVPVFGFANAGVSFASAGAATLVSPVPLGIAAGLFLGKQVGVFASAMMAIRAGLATMPAHATRMQLYGTAVLCGIGFTMSLFVGLLAFPNRPELQTELKVGVLAGSLLSGLLGLTLLALAGRRTVSAQPAADPKV